VKVATSREPGFVATERREGPHVTNRHEERGTRPGEVGATHLWAKRLAYVLSLDEPFVSSPPMKEAIMPRKAKMRNLPTQLGAGFSFVQRCRCVGPGFCGARKIHIRGQSYEHRKGWIRSRLEFLASIFAIDLPDRNCLLSNHMHLVLRTDVMWCGPSGRMEEVARRWRRLFSRYARRTTDAEERRSLKST